MIGGRKAAAALALAGLLVSCGGDPTTNGAQTAADKTQVAEPPVGNVPQDSSPENRGTGQNGAPSLNEPTPLTGTGPQIDTPQQSSTPGTLSGTSGDSNSGQLAGPEPTVGPTQGVGSDVNRAAQTSLPDAAANSNSASGGSGAANTGNDATNNTSGAANGNTTNSGANNPAAPSNGATTSATPNADGSGGPINNGSSTGATNNNGGTGAQSSNDSTTGNTGGGGATGNGGNGGATNAQSGTTQQSPVPTSVIGGGSAGDSNEILLPTKATSQTIEVALSQTGEVSSTTVAAKAGTLLVMRFRNQSTFPVLVAVGAGADRIVSVLVPAPLASSAQGTASAPGEAELYIQQTQPGDLTLRFVNLATGAELERRVTVQVAAQ